MSRARKKPEGGWNGPRVASGIYQRPGGTFNVAISVKNQTRKASFPTLEEAIAWRDEQKRERVPPRKRAFSVGIESVHRSTWEPADYEIDRQNIREQLKKSPKTTTVRDGREFTLVRLPFSSPVRETKWSDISPLKIAETP